MKMTTRKRQRLQAIRTWTLIATRPRVAGEAWRPLPGGSVITISDAKYFVRKGLLLVSARDTDEANVGLYIKAGELLTKAANA